MDGGWGWMVLIGAFVSYFIADGWAYSFGVLFPEMVDYFEESKGNTALVPTLIYGIPMVISPFICAITAVAGCRKVAIVGGLLACVTLVSAAFSSSFSLFCLFIGLFSSIGFAMTYVTSIIAVTCHFEKRRGLATGLAVTGSGLGSFAFPPLMGYLMEVYAWRGMLLIMGGICLELLVAGSLYRSASDSEHAENLSKKSCKEPTVAEGSSNESDIPMHKLLSKENQSSTTELQNRQDLEVAESSFSVIADGANVKPSTKSDISTLPDSQVLESHTQSSVSCLHGCRKFFRLFWCELRLMVHSMLDKSVLSDGPFLCFCGVNFFTYLWISVPYVYMVDRARLLGIDHYQADFLLSTIGIARTIGQVVIGVVGDIPKVSSNFLYGFSIAVIGAATMLVPVCTNYVSLSVYAAVFGLFVSVTYVLPMMCLVEIITLEKATNAFGLLQFVQGLGTLIGTPIVGFVFDMSGDYNISFYIAGAWILISGLVLCPMPCILRYARRCTTLE